MAKLPFARLVSERVHRTLTVLEACVAFTDALLLRFGKSV